MMFQLLLLLLAPLTASAQCSVCGEGLKVSTPDEIFAFPAYPVVSCGDLEVGGTNGEVSDAQCSILATLITDTCSCISDGTAVAPPTSPSPIADNETAAPSATPDSCSICGVGKTVTLPNAIFAFPNQPIVPCGTLEAVGFSGLIPFVQCDVLPNLLSDKCGCAPTGTAPFQAPTQAPGGGQPYIPPSQLFQAQKAQSDTPSKRLSGGAIGGIAAGVFLGAALLTLAAIRFIGCGRQRAGSKKNKSVETASSSTHVPDQSMFNVSHEHETTDKEASDDMGIL